MNNEILNDRINLAVNEVNRVYRQLALESGLSESVHRTLYILWTAKRPLTSAEILQIADLPKQTLSSALCKIRSLGLVVQETSRAPLELTEAGAQFCREKLQPTLDLELKVLDQMGSSDAEIFTRLFETYASLFAAGKAKS